MTETGREQDDGGKPRLYGGRPSLAETNPELAAEWDVEANGDLTPEQVTAGSARRVAWRCSAGHSWTAVISSRSRGSGCPVCAGQVVLAGYNDLATVNPELAAEWDVGANSSLGPDRVTESSAFRAAWCCQRGHRWTAAVYSRSSGAGCPFCSGREAVSGINDLESVRPDLAAEWDSETNGNLTPRSVRAKSNKRVGWRCKLEHRWFATIVSRALGNGCPVCGGKRVLAGFNDLATVRPDLSAEWDSDANDGLTPQQVTEYSGRRAAWRCTLGHRWTAAVHSRSSGRGCPFCAGNAVLSGFNDLATIRPALAAEWDNEANGGLTPQQVTASSGRTVAWRCKFGHRWAAKVAARSGGTGCPRCALIRSSKIEGAVSALCSTSFEEVTSGARPKVPWGRRNTSMALDIALTHRGRDVAIEYDGSYWHAGALKSLRDEQKTEALLDAGWLVIRIRENDLPHLDIVHPDLFQITHRYRQGTDEQLREQLEPVMAEIVRWLDGRVPEAGEAA